jgi:hypothetical protein
MSGAADDWAYEHLGVFSWTTEFWDVVEHATGHKQTPAMWVTGPTDDEALAVLRWIDRTWPPGFEPWRRFDHPQLGPVEIGGVDRQNVWNNPPPPLLAAEVEGHADAIIVQALASPRLGIDHLSSDPIGGDADTWRIQAGITNHGWLPTDVSAHARKERLVLPGETTVRGEGLQVIGGPARQEFGQLDGRAQLRFRNGNDGTPDRTLLTWLVRGPAGLEVEVEARHPRAGTASMTIELG